MSQSIITSATNTHNQHRRTVWCAQLTSLSLLACTLDESAEIADGEIQWEVNTGQQLDEEQIPSQQADYERQPTGSVLSLYSRRQRLGCAFGDLPIDTGEAAERWYQQQEDAEKDDVGPQRADEVDEAQEAHVELEEGECCREDGVGARRGRILGVIGDGRVIHGGEGRGECQPESTERSKDDEGKGVAEDELEEGAEDHQHTAEEVVGTAKTLSVGTRSKERQRISGCSWRRRETTDNAESDVSEATRVGASVRSEISDLHFSGTYATRASPTQKNVGQGCQGQQKPNKSTGS